MSSLILEPYIVELWEEGDLKGDPRAVAADWEARYSEPGRYHHNAVHIKEGFEFLKNPDFRAECDNPFFVKASWPGHDLKVSPGRLIEADELQSAGEAAVVYQKAGLGPAEIYIGIVPPILYTRHSVVVNNPTNDMRAIRDMDLWVLAQPWPRYEKYASDVAREWIESGQVTIEQFIPGRRDFLRNTFLNRRKGQIYCTNYCRRNLNDAAIENVRREISILESGRLIQASL
ncbi:MAG: hypothetical protein HY517_01785 [Candidatus Aenigmarchaeota archaeon]|nr:hypothetical protein [Candidatus Aenigmarchaeota archaeon]